MYINYDPLKNLIGSEQQFFEALDREVRKVESFYQELNLRAEVGLNNLLDSVPEDAYPGVYQILYEGWQFPKLKNTRKGWVPPARKDKRKNAKKLRETSVLEFYLIMSKILRYRELNKTGFRKILKKYDKQKDVSDGAAVFKQILAKPMFSDEKINQIWEFTKLVYRVVTPTKGKRRAKKMALDIINGDQDGDQKSFLSGCAVVGGLMLLLYRLGQRYTFWYAALGVLDWASLMLCVLWYLCRANYINYSMIMDFSIKPNIKLSESMLLVGGFCMLHGVCAVLYVPWTAAYVLTAAWLFLPLDLFYRDTRFYFISTVCQMFSCTLVTKVEFRHFFIADHLLSLEPILRALLKMDQQLPVPLVVYTALSTIPIGIRISQCLRRHIEVSRSHTSLHLYNLGKYLLMLLSKILLIFIDKTGILLAGSVLVLSNFVSLGWDFWVDWMMADRPRMYKPYTYFTGCTINVVIRAVSLLTFFLDHLNLLARSKEERNAVLLFVAFFELIRRGVWSIFRLEVEHLNNCDQLKATNGPLTDLFYLATTNGSDK